MRLRLVHLLSVLPSCTRRFVQCNIRYEVDCTVRHYCIGLTVEIGRLAGIPEKEWNEINRGDIYVLGGQRHPGLKAV